MNRVRLLQGDVLTAVRQLPSASVHTIITSPPYWGLRDYGIEPTVWPGLEYLTMSAHRLRRALGPMLVEIERE